jgi:hypothetical protein
MGLEIVENTFNHYLIEDYLVKNSADTSIISNAIYLDYYLLE